MHMEQAQGKPQSFIGVGYSSELAINGIQQVFDNRKDYMQDRYIEKSHMPVYKRYTIYPAEYHLEPQILDYVNNILDLTREYLNIWDLDRYYDITLADGFNLQSYKPYQYYSNWHCERTGVTSLHRSLTFMTYLNDIPAEAGGGTEFQHHDITVSAERGKTVIWPSDFTHIHRGQLTETHEKHIVTGWININDSGPEPSKSDLRG
jgi:hypothetical protein